MIPNGVLCAPAPPLNHQLKTPVFPEIGALSFFMEIESPQSIAGEKN